MSIPYQIPGLFLTALCHVIVIYHMLERRHARGKFVLYSCLYIVSFVCMGGHAYVAGGVKAVLTYLGIAGCLFLFFCVVSQECFSKKCFLFLTYFGLFSIIDNSLRLMMVLFLPRLSAPVGYYVSNVIRTAALLLMLALYKKYAVPVIRSIPNIGTGRWWKLVLIALMFYLLQVALIILNAWSNMPKLSQFLILVAVSLVMCAVYGVVFSNISYMKKDAEAALVRQNAEYLSAQISALQNAEKMHRRFRHDMRHHLKTIVEYAKADDVPGILAYVKEYSVEVSEAAVKQYSANSTVNMILSAYAGKAGECGIRFSVRCNVPEKLTVRDIDLIALLGNLLENALHGCQKSGKENTYIKIQTHLKNKKFVIICDNICSDNLELADGLPAGKGIGISSILTACQKYDGNLNYRVEDGICSVCAVLNL